MALASKKTPRVVDLTNSAKKAKLQAKFDNADYLGTVVDNPDDFPELAAILLQLQNINDDMDLVRTYAAEVKADIPTSAINANTSKTGTTSTERTRIAANHAKVGISDLQASIVNNLNPENGALIPTTTAKHTVSASVTKSNRGEYALVFTVVDGSGKSPVTVSATIALRA